MKIGSKHWMIVAWVGAAATSASGQTTLSLVPNGTSDQCRDAWGLGPGTGGGDRAPMVLNALHSFSVSEQWAPTSSTPTALGLRRGRIGCRAV